MNRHRGRIYEQRRQVLDGEDMSEQVKLWIDDVVEETVLQFTQDDFSEEWDVEALTNAMGALYGSEITAAELREDFPEITRDLLVEEFQADALQTYEAKEEEFGADLMRELERFVILQVVDVRWREHLENMDYLREGVHLRSMAQKDPLVEYTAEGERMFTELGTAIRAEVVLHLFHAELAPPEEGATAEQLSQPGSNGGSNGNGLTYEHETSTGAAAIVQAGASSGIMAGGVSTPVGGGATQQAVQASPHEKLGRNDPCWCGSGKKFKKCHGA
jgi:preprotein translocase subunit SecA